MRACLVRGRILILLLLIAGVCGTMPFGAQAQGIALAQSSNSEIHLLSIDGVINPLSSRYLVRGLEQAQEADAQAVILQLNTPGGLEKSMREMVQAMLTAQVPVIVFVGPPGARAASAGMFITIAGHVAAMAPGTNIGAAHPVNLAQNQRDSPAPDPTLLEKAVNDAAALARSIAKQRGRNAVWPEQAVRKSVSITAEEALQMNVVDLLAPNRQALLRALDGRGVDIAGTERILRTANASIREVPMNLAERILQTLVDPNIAYLLMTIGFIGILAELYNPGTLFPGLTGVISLIFAFTALGSLPINWAGFALLGLAFLLLTLELYTEGVGILAATGLIAFVLGSLMLYRPFTPVSPALPRVSVDPWLVALMALMVGLFFIFILRAIFRSRHAPIASGWQTLLGLHGVAVSDLDPHGIVKLSSGEEWSAVAEAPVQTGEPIEVTAVEGVTLTVQPLPHAPVTTAGAEQTQKEIET